MIGEFLPQSHSFLTSLPKMLVAAEAKRGSCDVSADTLVSFTLIWFKIYWYRCIKPKKVENEYVMEVSTRTHQIKFLKSF